jgi:hypothetical protein
VIELNKKGHTALALCAGTVVLSFIPSLATQSNLIPSVSLIIASVIGGIAVDFDHKTSTASQFIQFSAKKRHLLRNVSVLLGIVGIVLYVMKFYGNTSGDVNVLIRSAPLWIGSAVLLSLLARLRSLVLIGVGAMLLLGFSLFSWHWIAAFAGFAFLILPVVKHRGIIHTPEFATVLTLGLLSFSSHQSDIIHAMSIGFISGWWSHLLGDIFGSDGIHSLINPKIRIALKLFRNGGSAETWISRICWGMSLILWGFLIFNIVPGHYLAF